MGYSGINIMASGDLAAMRRECARKQAQARGAWGLAVVACLLACAAVVASWLLGAPI